MNSVNNSKEIENIFIQYLENRNLKDIKISKIEENEVSILLLIDTILTKEDLLKIKENEKIINFYIGKILKSQKEKIEVSILKQCIMNRIKDI